MNGSLRLFSSADMLVREAAAWLAGVLDHEVRSTGRATLVLSGGTTPRQLYALLASPEFRGRLAWNAIDLLWGDERGVPPDDPESNFRMVRESLLNAVDILPERIHRIRAELPPAGAAAAYEREIRELCRLGPADLPRFSVVLLGLGGDGHTASLFPGTPVLAERKRLVAEVYVPSLASWRITMTLPVLNNAANVLFLVSGSGKAGILKSVLEDASRGYPAQQINPSGGRLNWFADAGASAQLTTVDQK